MLLLECTRHVCICHSVLTAFPSILTVLNYFIVSECPARIPAAIQEMLSVQPHRRVDIMESPVIHEAHCVWAILFGRGPRCTPGINVLKFVE